MLLNLCLAIAGVAESAAWTGYLVFKFGIEEAGPATSFGLTTNLAGHLLLGPLWVIFWNAHTLLYKLSYIEPYTWPF